MLKFSFTTRAVAVICAMMLGLLTGLRGEASIIPLTDSTPVLDGVLNDACWGEALTLTNLTLPRSMRAPSQATTVKVCYNADFLYVAAICAEADTNRLVMLRTEENDNIWQDDAFEFWICDPTDNTQFDQFITTPLGVRESHLKPLPNGSRVRPQWKVACAVVEGAWVAELAVPFSDLGRDAGPVAGEGFQIKFGREDYTLDEEGVENSVWPPGAGYGERGNYGILFAQRQAYLQNSGLQAGLDGGIPNWEFTDIPGFLQSTREDDVPVAVFYMPGRYAYAEQRVQLPRSRLFSVTCETKGTAGGYLRARAGTESPSKTTVEIQPSEDWESRELLFPTDPSGRAMIIFGTTEDNEPGVLKVRNLALREENLRDFMGEPIRIDPRDDREVVIKALRVIDSRAVRGFCGAPVDGTTESWDWALRRWEYNMPGTGQGVKYDYLKNDGLHITLEDDRGVSAVQVRGGVRAKVVTDCTQYDDPASGTQVHAFEGRARNSMATFKKPLKSARFSFFDVRDGTIADLNFFRVGERRPKSVEVLRYGVTTGVVPERVQAALEERFGKDGRTAYALAPIPAGAEAGVEVPGGVARLVLRDPIHLVSAVVTSEVAVGAVGLHGRWTRTPADALLTVQVQDPAEPRTAIATVTVAIKSRGDLNLILDIPDQILQPGQCLWVTLLPTLSTTVEGLELEAHVSERSEALAEALAFRLLRLKGYFATMSENRPWTQLRYPEDLHGRLKDAYADIWPGLEAMFNALHTCHALAPHDPLVDEYWRWIYRAALSRAEQQVLKPVGFVGDSGAPEWAVAAREAWLGTRSVADWWLTHRAVPTGEFGSELNDDTDLWQNFANFPMFERDGVGGRLLDYGQRLWDLAVHGGYLEAGINAKQDDPLHAYEEGINHESMMLWWNYGDPVHVEQCMVAARSTEALTTINAAGHRHFKTHIVSSADLRNVRPNETDGFNHGLMMHPVQEVVWYNRNPRALQFLTEYCDAWTSHMQKPEAFATEVDTTTDEVLKWSYEPYQESMSFQAGLMLAATEAHDDPRFIKPAIDFVHAQGFPDYLRSYLLDFYEGGLLGNLDPIRDYLYKNSPMIRWRETGDKEAILADLREEIAEIRSFPNIYTTAEPFADRVFLEPKRKLTTSALAYTGGYATRNRGRHSHAVSWEGFGTNYAALVCTVRHDAFKTLVYNFSDKPLTGVARFWRLDHGEYLWASGIDDDGDDAIDRGTTATTLEIARGESVPLTLPPRAVTVLRLTKLRDLDRLEARADLALTRAEVTVVGETVRGLAHNIGATNVEDVIVALVDEKGTVRASVSLGALAAPLDLAPRRVAFNLAGLPEAHTGWNVVLDPERLVAEIYEGNNAVPLP